jgi:hypothetical protein
VTRLALLTILGIVTWYYFPETRAIMLDAAEPLVLPLARWSSREEMEQVARHVVDHERLTGTIPHVDEWYDWLSFRYPSPDAARDPWGTFYQLVVWGDSVGVVSYGPDRTRSTADDFVVATPRE